MGVSSSANDNLLLDSCRWFLFVDFDVFIESISTSSEISSSTKDESALDDSSFKNTLMLFSWCRLKLSSKDFDSLQVSISHFSDHCSSSDSNGILFDDSSSCNSLSDSLHTLASVDSSADNNSSSENKNSSLNCWSLLLSVDLLVSSNSVSAISDVSVTALDNSNSEDTSSDLLFSLCVSGSSEISSQNIESLFVFDGE